MERTIGQLIDELIVQQLKCWHAIDRMTAFEGDPSKMSREDLEELAIASQEAHRTNAKRSQLVTAIDKLIARAVTEGKAEVFVDRKTYE